MSPLRIPLLTALAAALAFCSLAASAGSARTARPGAQSWAARSTRVGNSWDYASALALSADGRRLFVTGGSDSGKSGDDYATLAYRTASGKKLWLARYNGRGKDEDFAYSLVVSNDGTKLFITGYSDSEYPTVAYDAASGKQLWVARYDGIASALALSPDASRLFVTGESAEGYGTLAYDAASGKRLWAAGYNGPRHGVDVAHALAISPDGTKLFVTGQSNGVTTKSDYATIAYDALTGAQLWLARYNGPPGGRRDEAFALAPSGDGTRVYVTGESFGGNTTTRFDYATLAYDAATGAQLWVARYNGPGNVPDSARALALSADGTRLFVTGESGEDYATVAYDAASGKKLWVAPYNGPGNGADRPFALALSADGTRLFVTGYSLGKESREDYATIAYDALTGAQLWLARYNGPGKGKDEAQSLAVSADGRKLFVTGWSNGGKSNGDYATLAYKAGSGKKLWVARYNGPGVCYVPYARRLPLAEAKAAIRAAGCSIGKVKHTYSPLKKGRVVSQKPKPGTRLAFKAKVKLVVSRGPKPKRQHARQR